MIRKATVCLIFTALEFIFCSATFAQPSDSLSLKHSADKALLMFLSHPDSSVAVINKNLPQVIEKKYHVLEGYYYFVLSKANWTKANFRLSVEFGFKALKILENSPEINLWGNCLVGLSRTFIDLSNYDQAATYLSRAEALAKQHHNLTLLADVYRERSMLLSARKQYDSALFYVDKGMALYRESADSVNISILYGRLARIHYNLGDYEQSENFNRVALQLDKEVGNHRALGISYLQAGQNAYRLGKRDSAVLMLNKSIPINKEIENHAILIRVHDLLATIYAEMGKSELAVEHFQLVSQYKDSLYNAQKNGQIQEMQSLYELENKDKTILGLEEENALSQTQVRNQRLISILLFVGLLLLGSLILVMFRIRRLQARVNRALKAKNKDIEQQKEEIQTQSENLHKLNQLKSKLFSVISHDLRGPINNLQALLELLTNQSLKPEEFVTVSSKLKGNLNLTQRTLENLLNWSLSQMDGLRTDPKPIALRNVIEDSRTLLDEVAQRKNLTLENHCPLTIVVLADSNQLQLILRNLVHNAIKFSKANATVTISASVDATFCTIGVRDYGMGMTPQEIDMVLGSNAYFSKMGTNQEKGTGLGLLLCKEFIQRNGGSMAIASEPGQGTEVSFTMPLSF